MYYKPNSYHSSNSLWDVACSQIFMNISNPPHFTFPKYHKNENKITSKNISLLRFMWLFDDGKYLKDLKSCKEIKIIEMLLGYFNYDVNSQ